MKKKHLLLALATAGTLLSSCSQAPQIANYDQVIPIPASTITSEGERFELSASTTISYPTDNEKMTKNATFLADYLHTITGKTFDTEANNKANKGIILKLGLQHDNPEAYKLEVNSQAITISGASEAGVFYGMQTLRKSLPIATRIELPCVTIEDAPRFPYRGIMLDAARHITSVEDLKTFIDILALHNINNFHWHLTEDQGWRLEIKKYPRLTEIGSMRKETVIGKNTGKYDGKPHGGFYTQTEAKEIVAYAADRHINVIPEIDLPGHMLAALTAYPEMGCTGGPYEVWTKWGVSDDVLCLGNDKTMQFITDVLSEVIEIFPSTNIHVGGDECPKVRWEACPKCQARIKTLGLKDDHHHTAEEKLQSYAIKHAEKFLRSHGRHLLGWDEILEGGLPEKATVMSWRGTKGGIAAAKQGYDVIMTPTTHVYFDYYQTTQTEDEPLAIGGYVPVEKVYNYEPIPAKLTAKEAQHIKGAQANLWTEYMPTFSHRMYMLLPRLAALSEVQWSQHGQKNYDNFTQRIPSLLKLYDLHGYNYAQHLFDVRMTSTPNIEKKNVEVTLNSMVGSKIYYTLDGSEPNKHSTLYTAPVSISQDCTFKTAAYYQGKRGRTLSEEFCFSLSSFKPIRFNEGSTPSAKYAFNGTTAFIDGLCGTTNFATGRWIGFVGKHLDVTIDLEQATQVSSVSINTCVSQVSWIFDARSLEVQASTDGQTYTTLGKDTYPSISGSEDDGRHTHTLDFESTTARYLRIRVESETSIPDWHSGKGKCGFLFVDEITVR